MASPNVSSKTLPSQRWWTKNTIAVVTGSNRGIGFAIAEKLARRGLTVVLTARDIAKGQAAANRLRVAQLPVEFCQLDVSNPASINNFALWLKDRFGGVDILVNNAGVSFNNIHQNSVDNAEIVIKTNYVGTKLLIETLLPLFRRSSTTSRILNLSSRLGMLNKVKSPSTRAMLQNENSLTVEKIENMVEKFLDQVKDGSWENGGWPGVWTDYSVSKIALNAYSGLLAQRSKGHNLSINWYCPGFTRTDMTSYQGSHTADDAAEVAVDVVLLHSDELPTGEFFKWPKPTLALTSKL